MCCRSHSSAAPSCSGREKSTAESGSPCDAKSFDPFLKKWPPR